MRKRETERERVCEKEGERDVEYGCFVFIFKGITGALAPFSYLINYSSFECHYAEYSYVECRIF